MNTINDTPDHIESATNTPMAIIDTNILMSIPRIHEFEWDLPAVNIFILNSVFEELRGLKRERFDKDKARKAQRSYDILDNLQKRTPSNGLPLRGGKDRLFFVDTPEEIGSPLDPSSVDHQQIAFAQKCMSADPSRFCAIVTQDREMSTIASTAKPEVQVVSPAIHNIEESLRRQFAFRLDMWQSWRKEQKPAPEVEQRKDKLTTPQSIKPVPTQKRTARDPEARLKNIVSNFYGRIKANRHRVILSIAPLQARLELTAHIVNMLERTPRRVVMLFVESQLAAEWWAAEIREKCGLPANAVLVFRDQGLPRDQSCRVVVYRHDQIETRFKQHSIRLSENGRLISIIVDSCDLLSPEDLAILLFEDHQFIGYTLYHLGHAQARGGRMLTQFFEQQSILSYSFADAEEDGWLRSFDLIRHPILWLSEEKEEYDKANAAFIDAYNNVLKEYPSLSRGSDFWDTLEDLLDVVADARTANLFILRERREEMAQIAHAKLDAVQTILRANGSRRGANLLYDPCGYWTPVLTKFLQDQNMTFEQVTKNITFNEWEDIWHRFEHNKFDVILFSSMPPFGLNQTNINRLIITTPITSLAALAAVTDWTLTHANPLSRNPVEIHILYVPATPEEQAMLDFADSVCGLRFR